MIKTPTRKIRKLFALIILFFLPSSFFFQNCSPSPLATSGGPTQSTDTNLPTGAETPGWNPVKEVSNTPTTGFFVAPNGTPSGDGSINNPWDLQTALNHPSRVSPGDIIWLRGGTYRGLFRSRLRGTPGHQIIVRGYPREKAKIDGHITLPLGQALAAGEGISQLCMSGVSVGDNLIIESEFVQVFDTAPGVNCFRISRALDSTAAVAHAVGATVMKRGPIIDIQQPYVAFWGFEITHSYTQRNNINSERGSGIYATVPGVKIINMIIHNTGHPGIGLWQGAEDNSEIYGTLVWGSGVYDTNGTWTRGSGIYTQNKNGTKYLRDNIWFRNFTTGINIYTTNGFVDGFHVEGNISFDHFDANEIFAGSENNPIRFLKIFNNFTYKKPGDDGTSLRVGYGASYNEDVIISGNFLSSSRNGVEINQFRKAVFTNNRVTAPESLCAINHNKSAVGAVNYTVNNNQYMSEPGQAWFGYMSPTYGPNRESFSSWQSFGFDLVGSTRQSSLPTSPEVFVRPNVYERGRGHVIIYNWNSQSQVSVNLSTILSVGDGFDVYDAQNIIGPPVLSGTYTGSAVQFPLNLTAVAPLVGNVSHISNTHTPIKFGAYVVMRK